MAVQTLKPRLRVRASSILEVVVAMVVILVVFGIALTIFSNVIRWSLPYRKITAEAVLQDIQNNMPTSGQSQLVNGFRIARTVIPYEPDLSLSVLTLTAFDENNEKIAELQKIVVAQE